MFHQVPLKTTESRAVGSVPLRDLMKRLVLILDRSAKKQKAATRHGAPAAHNWNKIALGHLHIFTRRMFSRHFQISTLVTIRTNTDFYRSHVPTHEDDHVMVVKQNVAYYRAKRGSLTTFPTAHLPSAPSLPASISHCCL